ncbi:hypothetical protein GCM10010357_28590 [Streptomyces luteireticuli]|uniref:Uncharacterized protein n=1 Tax=Streptomyces luteireticuli TaxID=173858 RepID=A0ABP3IIU3_9ACTN
MNSEEPENIVCAAGPYVVVTDEASGPTSGQMWPGERPLVGVPHGWVEEADSDDGWVVGPGPSPRASAVSAPVPTLEAAGWWLLGYRARSGTCAGAQSQHEVSTVPTSTQKQTGTLHRVTAEKAL